MTLGANMRVHLVRMIILTEPEVSNSLLRTSVYSQVHIWPGLRGLLFNAGGHVIRSSSRIISLPCYDQGLSWFFPGGDPAVVQHHLFSQERVRLGQ